MSIVGKVVEISGRNPDLCYQCGMCSAVCPMADYMDVLPHAVVRMIQLGLEKVMNVDSVWKCISCMACVDRCPRDVGPGVLFEAIRITVMRRGVDRVDYRVLSRVSHAPSLALVALSRKMTR